MSRVVIQTRSANIVERIKVPYELEPSGYRDVTLYYAEVVDPEVRHIFGSGVLYTSPPRLPLNACANAMAWARERGHKVLGGNEARAAFRRSGDRN